MVRLVKLRMVEIESAPAQLKEMLIALVQLRSKEIGSQTPIARITYPVRSGSVMEANQPSETLP
jgi:hypothetical protein